MMSNDQEFDTIVDEIENLSLEDDFSDDGLSPFEDPSAIDEDDVGMPMGFYAQRLQTQNRRYLLQLRCELPRGQRHLDDQQCALNLLARSITTLGGQIEHHVSMTWLL